MNPLDMMKFSSLWSTFTAKPSKIPKIYCRRFPQRRTGRRFCDRNADYYPER